MTEKQFDPKWPFPQYDEEGKQLWPKEWEKKQPVDNVPWDVEECML